MPIPEDANTEKLAEAALGLLWLSAHGDEYGTRVWKGLDWDVMNLRSGPQNSDSVVRCDLR